MSGGAADGLERLLCPTGGLGGRLLDLAAERGIQIPAEVQPAHTLTRFAVVFRYPGIGQPPEVGDHERAVRLARAVVAWAERSVETCQPADGES